LNFFCTPVKLLIHGLQKDTRILWNNLFQFP
jgi:hypothetical protein